MFIVTEYAALKLDKHKVCDRHTGRQTGGRAGGQIDKIF